MLESMRNSGAIFEMGNVLGKTIASRYLLCERSGVEFATRNRKLGAQV